MQRALGAGALLGVLLLVTAGCGSASARPQSITSLLSQVRKSFGDHRLLSASVNGRALTVKVTAPSETSAISATFEAQILAAAVHDAEAASGQTPIDAVRYRDARGHVVRGYGVAPVGTDTARHPLPKVPPLAKGACESAAHAAQAVDQALTIRSALTLPYGDGGCAFRFQTSRQWSGYDYSSDLYKLVIAMGYPDERAFLVEVDNKAGVPLFLDDSTPGGGGVLYNKPGSLVLHPIRAHQGRYTVRQVERAFAYVGLSRVAIQTKGIFVVVSFAKPPQVLSAYIVPPRGCPALCVYPRMAGARMTSRRNVGIYYSLGETNPATFALSFLR
jgi:hypothetical protein